MQAETQNRKPNLFFTAHKQKQIDKMKQFHKDIFLLSDISKTTYVKFDETLRFLRQLPKRFRANRLSSNTMTITCSQCNILLFKVKIDFNMNTSFILFSCLCPHILLHAIPIDTLHVKYYFNVPLDLQVLPIELMQLKRA